MIDKLRKMFKSDQIDFNMYNNSNTDDCKYKYNSLIYFIAGFITDLKEGNYSRKDFKYFLDILRYNKEAILLYLNLTTDILSNQAIDENILLNENMSYVTDLKGNLDLSTLEGKKLVLNQIRNVFAHKSGKINFYVDNNIKKVKIENRGWFSIEANLTDLNNLLSKIIVRDPRNDVQKTMLDMISAIQSDNYQNISDDAVIIMLMNLLMCYNKESLFDRFMLTQSSFIDASDFEINSTSNWHYTEASLRQRFFDKFNISFHSSDDKISYNNEWKSIVDIDNSTNTADSTYIYDTSKMPFDSYTNKHIPIPIFMNYLRNANSHGWIKVEGDYFIFYNKENSGTSQPNFYMKISKENLLKFILNDYFVESITIPIDDHQNKYSSDLYLLEQAESVNSFYNYIDIYRNKMPHLSETEVIKYIYENNKFSSYLMEYPDQIDSFLDYKLKDGRKLTTFLCQLNNAPESLFHNININSKMNNKLKNNFFRTGLDLYTEYLDDAIGKKYLKEIDYDFFKLYYLFMRNLKNINPNIHLENVSQLDLDTKGSIEKGIKELQYEFIDNDVFLDVSESSKRIYTEIGMQKSNIRELDKIIFAIALGKQQKKEKEDAKENDKKECRHTIKNIEKHSSLAHVFEESASRNYKLSAEEKKLVGKVLAFSIGVRLFNIGFAILGNKIGMLPPSAGLFSYVTSTFIANMAIWMSWYKFRNIISKMLKQKKRVEKYSEEYNGGTKDENRIDGSHIARR